MSNNGNRSSMITYNYGAATYNYDTNCVTDARMQEKIAHLVAKAYYDRMQERLAMKSYVTRRQEFLAHLASYDEAHCVTSTRMQGRLTMKSWPPNTAAIMPWPPNTAAMESSPATAASMAMKSWHSNTAAMKSLSSTTAAMKSLSSTTTAMKSLSSTTTAMMSPSSITAAMKSPSSTATMLRSSSCKPKTGGPNNYSYGARDNMKSLTFTTAIGCSWMRSTTWPTPGTGWAPSPPPPGRGGEMKIRWIA